MDNYAEKLTKLYGEVRSRPEYDELGNLRITPMLSMDGKVSHTKFGDSYVIRVRKDALVGEGNEARREIASELIKIVEEISHPKAA